MHECPECGMVCDCDGEDTWMDSSAEECEHGCEPFEDEYGDEWGAATCVGCGEPVNLGGETCGAAECGGKRLPKSGCYHAGRYGMCPKERAEALWAERDHEMVHGIRGDRAALLLAFRACARDALASALIRQRDEAHAQAKAAESRESALREAVRGLLDATKFDWFRAGMTAMAPAVEQCHAISKARLAARAVAGAEKGEGR